MWYLDDSTSNLERVGERTSRHATCFPSLQRFYQQLSVVDGWRPKVQIPRRTARKQRLERAAREEESGAAVEPYRSGDLTPCEFDDVQLAKTAEWCRYVDAVLVPVGCMQSFVVSPEECSLKIPRPGLRPQSLPQQACRSCGHQRVMGDEDVQSRRLRRGCKHVVHQITRRSIWIGHPGQRTLGAYQMLHHPFVAECHPVLPSLATVKYIGAWVTEKWVSHDLERGTRTSTQHLGSLDAAGKRAGMQGFQSPLERATEQLTKLHASVVDGNRVSGVSRREVISDRVTKQ